jgi:perosamine synthetase
MSKQKIFYTKPSISTLEIKYATDAATNGWGENCYDYINRFEKLFKNHLGVKYSIATSSCTGALHMGMSALNIGPGDEVIMADTNWIATASPIVHLGAKPVFVDILKDSWCLDPNKVESAINSKTKAIIAVHLYGNLCEMDKLLQIGKKYNIPVIEDSAEAIGSVYKGSRAGSMGLFGTFSFHGSKTITTGEGGMFVTNNSEIYEKVLTLSNHGRSREQQKQFWSDVVGFKYKLSNIQAAIGCAQMERIEELINRKRNILKLYKKNLEIIDGITMNPEPKETINGSWMPTIIFDKQLGVTREKIKDALNNENIDARVFFWPLSSLPMFQSIKENINSISICERAINLPSYFDIQDEQIERICEIVKLQI